jgi:hypothetical protein
MALLDHPPILPGGLIVEAEREEARNGGDQDMRS